MGVSGCGCCGDAVGAGDIVGAVDAVVLWMLWGCCEDAVDDAGDAVGMLWVCRTGM